MIIDKIREKLKSLDGGLDSLYLVLLIIVVAFLSFGLGKLSVLSEEKHGVTIEGGYMIPKESEQKEALQTGTMQSGIVVGSKNGSKYHYPWCSGAARIKEENKILFSSPEEAQRAGYTPAGNCPGL